MDYFTDYMSAVRLLYRTRTQADILQFRVWLLYARHAYVISGLCGGSVLLLVFMEALRSYSRSWIIDLTLRGS